MFWARLTHNRTASKIYCDLNASNEIIYKDTMECYDFLQSDVDNLEPENKLPINVQYDDALLNFRINIR
jgi:hypothetical protein